MAYDSSIYEATRRNLLSNYSQQAAMNAYRQYLAQTQGERQLKSLQERAFGPTATGGLGEVPKLTSSYARRGLYGRGVRSGTYNQALNEYARQRARALGQAQEDIAGAMRGFDITGRGYQSELERGLADLEMSKARQISEDAQALLNLR